MKKEENKMNKRKKKRKKKIKGMTEEKIKM